MLQYIFFLKPKTNPFGGDSSDYLIWLYVFCYNSSCCNYCAFSYCYTLHYGYISPYPVIPFNYNIPVIFW